jgi:hypothetical protein
VSQRGCLLLCALILLPFFIIGLIRMNRKAARRAKYSSADVCPMPRLAPRHAQFGNFATTREDGRA